MGCFRPTSLCSYPVEEPRAKDRLAESITESISKILGVDKKEVIVAFQESPTRNYAESKSL